MSYEDDFFNDGGDPDYFEEEEFYGDYGDEDLDDDRFGEFAEPGTTMGKAEITAFERVGPSMADPWITKMTNLPKQFKNSEYNLSMSRSEKVTFRWSS